MHKAVDRPSHFSNLNNPVCLQIPPLYSSLWTIFNYIDFNTAPRGTSKVTDSFVKSIINDLLSSYIKKSRSCCYFNNVQIPFQQNKSAVPSLNPTPNVSSHSPRSLSPYCIQRLKLFIIKIASVPSRNLHRAIPSAISGGRTANQFLPTALHLDTAPYLPYVSLIQ